MNVRMDPAITALRDGQAFVDLSGWRKILVHGTEAASWLNDLLSAELEGLGVGRARRSLLLSPTGRIRADLTAARLADGFLLVQDPRQPSAVNELLAPYVLSSDVHLDDRTEDLALLACPGADPPSIDGAERYRPSALGQGVDVLAPAESRPDARAALGLAEAGPEAFEAWRIERGMARFGVDLAEDSLPHEADVGSAIAYDKGCFLGQEAVAKIRNLGRPPFVVLAARSPSAVSVGQPVLSNGAEAGRVTSAAPVAGGSALIARVRWEARDAELRTRSGEPLRDVGLASGPG
jgi:folate-binding protein YgfZ